MSANELEISEVGGASPLRIVLRGRAMPYRGVETGGDQRIRTTWYQGNPKASQQIMGSTLSPTTFTGTWKSKFLRVAFDDRNADVELDGSPEALVVASGRQDSNPASLVVSVFERLRDRGKEVRVVWGDIIRYGLLQSFTPTWDRLEDVAWSATFEWNGRVERVPRTSMAVTFGKPTQTALVRADDALVRMPRTVEGPARRDVLSRSNAVRGRALEVIGYARQASATVAVPLRVVQGMAASVSAMRQSAEAAVVDLLSVPYEAFTIFDTVRDVFAVEDFRRTLGLETEALEARALRERNEVQSMRVELRNATAIRCGTATTLQALSAKYYGTADDWPLIAEANGMNTPAVPAGALVFVPARATSSTAEVSS